MSTSASGAVYRFDRFVLYPDRGVLLSAEGGEIALRPKAFTLLRVVGRERGAPAGTRYHHASGLV